MGGRINECPRRLPCFGLLLRGRRGTQSYGLSHELPHMATVGYMRAACKVQGTHDLWLAASASSPLCTALSLGRAELHARPITDGGSEARASELVWTLQSKVSKSL